MRKEFKNIWWEWNCGTGDVKRIVEQVMTKGLRNSWWEKDNGTAEEKGLWNSWWEKDYGTAEKKGIMEQLAAYVHSLFLPKFFPFILHFELKPYVKT